MIVKEIEYVALEEVKLGGVLFRKGSSLPYPGWNYQGLMDCGKVKRIVNMVDQPVPKAKKKYHGKKRRNKSS